MNASAVHTYLGIFPNVNNTYLPDKRPDPINVMQQTILGEISHISCGSKTVSVKELLRFSGTL